MRVDDSRDCDTRRICLFHDSSISILALVCQSMPRTIALRTASVGKSGVAAVGRSDGGRPVQRGNSPCPAEANRESNCQMVCQASFGA